MEGCTIVNIAPPDMAYYTRVNSHIYPDIPGLLLMAAIEGDGAVDEVWAMIVVEAEQGRSVSSRCL